MRKRRKLRAGIVSGAIYKVDDLAKIMGVHPVTIYKNLSDGKDWLMPKYFRFGRAIRFRGKDIIAFIDGQVAER